jgi:hypothetical protein
MVKQFYSERYFFMRKALFLLSAVTVVLYICTGCATVQELPPAKRIGEPVSQEYKLSRDLLICFMNNDPAAFCKKLSPENVKQFDARKFEETRNDMARSLGTPVSFAYLTELEFVSFKLYVWKVKFKRIGKDRESGKEKEFFSEALFRVITGRTAQNQVLVMGFNFL